MKKISLRFLTLCDYATVSQEGKLSIIGIFDRISSKEVPLSFARTFIVAIVEGEPNTEHEVELNIQSPKRQNVLPPITFKIKLSYSGRSNLITDIVNIPLPDFGEYSLSLKSGGRILGTTTFWVNRLGEIDEDKQGKLPN